MEGLKAAMDGETSMPPPTQPPAFAVRPPALEAIATAFDLSSFERGLLLFCAAFELEPDVPRLCGKLSGARPEVTFSVALSVLPDGHWSALAPEAPLRHWRLIEIGQNHPLTLAPLRIDETVLHSLVGIDAMDPRIAAVLKPLPACSTEMLTPSHAGLVDELVAAWRKRPLDDTSLVRLVGNLGDCRSIIAAAAADLRLKPWMLGVQDIPAEATMLDQWARIWSRQVRLGGADVLLVEPDETGRGEDHRPARSAAARLVDRISGRIALTDPDRAIPVQHDAHTIEVGILPPAEQHQVWERALTSATEPSESTAAAARAAADLAAAEFSLSRSSIESIAANAAEQTARVSSPSHGLARTAWDLCRTYSRRHLDGLALRIRSSFAWEDLVLPDAELKTLRAIAAQVRQRMTVYQRWGFADKSRRGLGISALFSGPSGTGKTMAAEVLANDLQLDLYRIDLASVISKYIGETEKNLARVFAGAEQSGAVLLFDEADALFGKRSEVRDSHDRYANIEVSYLLQQMEAYRGLAILTSNMKTALDQAFLRRLRFVVRFPFPDAVERQRLWKQVFPQATPTEGLDFEKLAQLKITGGNIRTIAINAAFLAAEAKEPISMTHLREATRMEYAKLERNLTAGEIQLRT
jgi:hypothetical protein